MDMALTPAVTQPAEAIAPPTWAELDKLITGHRPAVGQPIVNEPNNSVPINAPEACEAKFPSFIVLATSHSVADALPEVVSRGIGSARSQLITSPMYVSVARIRGDQAPNLDLALKHLRSSETSSGQDVLREVSPSLDRFQTSHVRIISEFVNGRNSGRDWGHTTT